MNQKIFDALRQVVYHKLKMWDASRDAEKLVGGNTEFDTGSDELDYLCASLNDADDALKLTEEDLRMGFPNLD